MNRHGDGATIRSAIKRLRDSVPGIILRTTAMVGFPGECEEDFEELCLFVKEARFERFGAFTYSEEEGTAAYDLDSKVDPQTAQDRYDVLMQTQLTVSEELNAQRLGGRITVLCDGYDSVAEIYYGRSEADAPDVDGRVYFSAPKGAVFAGDFVTVEVTECLDYDLIGKAILD